MINMTNLDYRKSCTEVLAILNNMSIENFKKIPRELIEAFETSKDADYDFSLDYSKDLKDQDVSEFTLAILNNLYRDYLASEEEKNMIMLEEKQKRSEEEKIKREKYNPDDIFKKKTQVEDSNESVAMVKYKETIFSKIIKKIKEIFHIKH